MAKRKVRKKRRIKKFTRQMKSKMFLLFGIVILLFCGLIGRIMYIEYTKGAKYQKIVLAQQVYDSSTIPYQRGDIVDTNGTVLATSISVYNIILDCYVMTSKEEYVKPTIQALTECFPDLEKSDLETYAREKKDNRYIVLARKLPYESIQDFVNMQNAVDEKGKKINPNIQGVWFEKEYQRYYPFNTLASAVLGFTSAGNVGTSGLENYYNDLLNGTDGRVYGYLNSDSNFEKTLIEAENGKDLIITIDANIQSIVEEKILEFNEAYRDNYRSGDGSVNTAVLIMDPNTGEILAMASYPDFNCNDPRDLTVIYTEEEVESFSDQETLDALNRLWQNFCVTSTYEPGSAQKVFTEACGLETGVLSTNMTFECDGFEEIGEHTIHCVLRSGHGTETLQGALMDSCNDAVMQMSYKIGVANFTKYQSIFGFGQKTGIDLPGEASTASLVYTEDNMKMVDLATNAFGQNYNCTMIQMASAFASVINGGIYYQPHVVRKITDSNGNTLSTITPYVLKQTVSKGTSDLLKSYLGSVVSEGTGKKAKVDGYSMGGKTGTAQKSINGQKSEDQYLVSFIGFAPLDNPQLLIYTIIDEPNVEDQAHSSYAQNLTREILEEVLPYMNIYMDEEKKGTNEGLDITGNNPQESQKREETSDTPAGT